ncbi:MAG: TIGR00725 family protein [Chloroflexi bacterium]|nr:TIGR00725 family protein [Chloroflexota bacterium]
MEKKRQIFISVIGGGECSPHEAGLAEEVGREIARRGGALICGGLGGIMNAACQGARSEGGLTIGILPGPSRQGANPHVQVPIVTNLGEARNVIVAKSGDAVIAIGGSYGTLSEIAHALRNGTPVIGPETWSLSRSGQVDSAIIVAKSAQDAVSLAFDLIG